MRQNKFYFMIFILILFCSFLVPSTWAADEEIKMSEEAEKTEHDEDAFGPDPSYEEKPYDIDAQLAIYGGKYKVKTARPLFELGDRLYWDGPVPLGGTPFGEKNPNAFWLMAYGDWRTAVGYNSKANNGKEFARVATKINLDFDMRLTSTERIHWLITPVDRDGNFTRYDFARPEEDDNLDDSEFEGDVDVDTLFFEGDFGPIFAGMTGREKNLDLPFSFGLVPMFTQNGVWVEDAFTGLAITPLSARSSRAMGISNFDLTFYAGFDRVSTPAVVDQNDRLNNSEKNTRIFGAFGFAEANQGYWEFGYGYIDSEIDGLSYNNVTLAHTRRFRHRLSNSIRVIGNFGQEGQLFGPPEAEVRRKTADGILLLIENSLITSKPSTLVPYFNLFVGFDKPQALARDPGAGGVLKNTGLNFEGDAITAMPKLDADANNTFGGAIGVQYLFNLNQQLVVEFATVIPHGDDEDRFLQDNQYGIDVRYQRPITNAWIIRADVMKGFGESDTAAEDLFGVRLELRRKF